VPSHRLQPALQPIEAGVGNGFGKLAQAPWRGGILTGHAGGDEEDTKEERQTSHDIRPARGRGRVMLHPMLLRSSEISQRMPNRPMLWNAATV
jgi:hypothetical protein